MKKIYLGALTCLYLAGNAQQTFTNFMNASLVVGQANFTSSSSTINQNTLYGTTSSAISSKGVLACGSQSAKRVLIWNTVPTTNGANADIVIGANNFTSSGTGVTQSSTSYCEGIAFTPDGNKMVVADAGNNRVLIWNTIPTVNGQNADVVIGQTNFTTSLSGSGANKLNYPSGVLITPDGKLIVSDMYNNRVLIYNTIPTVNGASADVVIGQSTFTTVTSACSATEMEYPWYLSISQAGQLLVADHGNNRVLVYNTVPTTNGAAADVVIGQTTFTSNVAGTTASNFSYPIGVTCAPDGKVAIAEFSNNRVLIYNSVPTVNGASANIVLGQPNFTSSTPYNGGVSAQSMQAPYGISFDLNGRLFVNGRDMHRVMVFGSVPTQTADVAVSVAGSATTLCTGNNVNFTVTVSNSGPATASNVVVNTALPAQFNFGSATASMGTYTAASGWWTIPSIASGSMATLVLSGTANTSNATLTSYANITNSDAFDSNLNNNGAGQSVSISSAVPPTGGAITANTIACAGSSQTLAVSGVTNATSYVWSASNATVTGTGTLVNVAYGTGNSTVMVVPSNSACTGNAIAQSVSVAPLPTLTTSATNSVLCAGQTGSISVMGASTYSWNTTSTSSVIAVSPSVTTSYTVTGVDGNGCSNVASVSQSVAPLPSVMLSSSTGTLCVGQTATITASGANAYVWNTSATTASIAVNPTITTSYTVTGTDANGCAATATISQNVSACTGIASHDLNSLNINVAPNPNNGMFNVTVPTVMSVSVYNQLGQNVLNVQLQEGVSEINMNEFSAGVYFIKSDKGTTFAKFVIVK